jgi:hypothetical protein
VTGGIFLKVEDDFGIKGSLILACLLPPKILNANFLIF